MRELSLNVMDICQNSVTANSSLIEIFISENMDEETLVIEINDNGKGMSEEQLLNVMNPFFTTRTTRKVGMGIPLFKMAAELTGGSLTMQSKLSVGTKLKATFITSHIDMTPIGDMNSTVLPLVTGNTDIDFLYIRKLIKNGEEKSFTLNTKEMKEILGEGVSLNLPDVVIFIRDFLNENTMELYR